MNPTAANKSIEPFNGFKKSADFAQTIGVTPDSNIDNKNSNDR